MEDFQKSHNSFFVTALLGSYIHTHTQLSAAVWLLVQSSILYSTLYVFAINRQQAFYKSIYNSDKGAMFLLMFHPKCNNFM